MTDRCAHDGYVRGEQDAFPRDGGAKPSSMRRAVGQRSLYAGEVFWPRLADGYVYEEREGVALTRRSPQSRQAQFGEH